MLCDNFAQGRVLCENFAQDTIHPPFCKIEARSNGENFCLLRLGNVGWGRKKDFSWWLGLEIGAFQEENLEFGSFSSWRQWVSYEETVAWILSLKLWFGKSKVGIGLGMDLECWVKNWRVFYAGKRRKSLKLKVWTVVNSEGHGYGVKLWGWAAMVVLRMGNDEGEELKDGNGWSEERCWEKWRRSLEFEEENMAFKEEVRISHKVMGSAKISHSCDFRIEILGRDREHAFWKLVTKENSHKGMCCAKISHKRIGWCEFCCVLAFLPCFPLFSFFKLSYLYVNTKNQFKPH